MIKEWRKTADGTMEWTGRIIKPFVYSDGNGIYDGEDPLVFLLEDPANEYDTGTQNASPESPVAPGSIKTHHPYPPYAQEEIVAPEVTSDFLG